MLPKTGRSRQAANGCSGGGFCGGLTADTGGLPGKAHAKPQNTTGRRQSERCPRSAQAHPIPNQAGLKQRQFSIGEHVFVIGHRVHIVTGFGGVWPRQPLRRQAGRRVMPRAEVQAAGCRLEARGGQCLRRERRRPLRTLEVSMLKADSSRWEGSERKPRRKARPSWYSTSRAEP